MVQGEGLVVGQTKSGVKVMRKESQGRARKNKQNVLKNTRKGKKTGWFTERKRREVKMLLKEKLLALKKF